ncbi:MAG: GDYXXLXY domain-containing protein [Pseudomonadota bacterium]
MNAFSTPRGLAIRIALVVALLIAALIGLLVREDRARASGVEVRLAMEAFDPRSLLSGHYAALQLTEALPPQAPCPPDLDAHFTSDDSWVALSPTAEGHHRVSGGGGDRETAAEHGPVQVRGQAACREAQLPPDREGDGETPAEPQTQQIVTLDIGISRFYADQQAAEAMEAALREAAAPGGTAAFAIVSVGRDGRARLKGVEIDGGRTELGWF